MKNLISILAFVGLSATSASALEPIPGSITYNGQPHSRLQKAPVGSIVNHEFIIGGNRYHETYLIQPDRSLKLSHRSHLGDR